jgi:hypothetical protein
MLVQEENEDVQGAKTQSLYREVNERVKSVNESFSIDLPLGEWLCECADPACDERIEMSPAAYEEIRASSVRFVVAPEHVYPNIERVVDRTDRYWVVEKHGDAGALAAKFDPRSRVIANRS